MKKSTLSLWFIGASIVYALFLHFKKAADIPLPTHRVVQEANPPAASAPAPVAETPAPTPTPAPVPVPAPKPKGMYADGTYNGNDADAYYGLVQVQVVISGGQIQSAHALKYPNDRSTSRYISSQSIPILEQEAIQAQNANIDIVSGATDTSQAFRESLANALAQAKN